MMTLRQKKREGRFYEVVMWEWDEKQEEYAPKSYCDLTLEEATKLFKDSEVSVDVSQIEIRREPMHEDDDTEIIARKVSMTDGPWETWDKAEM